MRGFFGFGSPIIELVIKKRKIDFLLDTGFNGYIMLPKKLISELDLDEIGFSDYVTASGEKKETTVYKVDIEFLDEKMEVPVLSTDGNFSLAGMDLFKNCKIVIERNSNTVEIIKTSVTV